MKAKLVIDMPENCEQCILKEDGWWWHCHGTNCRKEIPAEGANKRPDWCPLIPIESDVAIFALEKQTAKAVNKISNLFGINNTCPICNTSFEVIPNYCPSCGQRLRDWKEPTIEEAFNAYLRTCEENSDIKEKGIMDFINEDPTLAEKHSLEEYEGIQKSIYDRLKPDIDCYSYEKYFNKALDEAREEFED